MQNSILMVHVIFGVLFIFSVLVQDKGTGLSAAFGGSGGFYASQRGAAKVFHYVTLVLCLGFFLTALLYVMLEPSSAPVSVESVTAE